MIPLPVGEPQRGYSTLRDSFCPALLGEGAGGMPGSFGGAGSHGGGALGSLVAARSSFPRGGGAGTERPGRHPSVAGLWDQGRAGGGQRGPRMLSGTHGDAGIAATNHHPCGPGASPDKPSADPAHA